MKRLKYQCDRLYYPLKISISNRTLVKPRKIRSFKNDRLVPDLHSILIKIAVEANSCTRKKTLTCKKDFLKLLDKVVSNDYFGCTKNRKIFYVAVKKILTASTNECIYVKSLIHSYNYETVPWLSKVTDEVLCRRYALIANLWLMNFIVKPLIRYFYKSLYMNSNEMILVEKTKWQKFESNAFDDLLKSDCLTFDSTCIKTQQELKTRKHLLGQLRIFPKNDFNAYRPIVVTRFDQSHKKVLRNLSRIISKEAKRYSLKRRSLYEYWKTFTARIRNEKCYGIKIDVSDAYGAINTDVLCNLIDNIRNSWLSNEHKVFIKKQIKEKFVIFRTHKGKPLSWKWIHGIPQGSVLSGSLCELYMSYLDYKNLTKFCREDTFLYRYVDDYFFCATDEKLVAKFLNKVTNLHQQNQSKLQAFCNEVNFCGKIFNLETGEVRGFYEYKKNTPLRHRFRFWNEKRPIKETEPNKFLKEAMLFRKNSFHFDALEMNTIFNSEMVVLQNVFHALLYTAYKFDAAVMAIYDMQTNKLFMYTELKKTIIAYAVWVEKKINKYRGEHFHGNINKSTLIYVSYKAFELVLKRRNEVYKDALQKLHKDVHCRVTDYVWQHNECFKKLPPVFQQLSMKRAL